MVAGFVPGVGAPSRAAGVAAEKRVHTHAARASRVVVRMSDVEDVLAAQNCLEEGCEVNEVQEILGRLEMKKAALEEEVVLVTKVMADLAKHNLSEDRNLVQETMEAAISIFKRADDKYPSLGSPTPWTMEKAKKKRWD